MRHAGARELSRVQGLSKYQMAGQAIAIQFNWQLEAQVTAPNGGAGTTQLDVEGWTLPLAATCLSALGHQRP